MHKPIVGLAIRNLNFWVMAQTIGANVKSWSIARIVVMMSGRCWPWLQHVVWNDSRYWKPD
jgi:hypothetical protein